MDLRRTSWVLRNLCAKLNYKFPMSFSVTEDIHNLVMYVQFLIRIGLAWKLQPQSSNSHCESRPMPKSGTYIIWMQMTYLNCIGGNHFPPSDTSDCLLVYTSEETVSYQSGKKGCSCSYGAIWVSVCIIWLNSHYLCTYRPHKRSTLPTRTVNLEWWAASSSIITNRAHRVTVMRLFCLQLLML